MLFTPQTNYDKAIIFVITLIVAVVPPILNSGLDLGLPQIALNWLSVLSAIGGTILGTLQQNKNQPTIPPYHAIADLSDIKPGAELVAVHK